MSAARGTPDPAQGRSVGIMAFDEMEVLDFAGPYEVFNVAGDLSTPPGAFRVVTVGVTAEPVGRGGFCVRPDHLLEDAPHLDVLVIPGGAGSRTVMKDSEILTWVRDRYMEAERVLTVCTGALIAASAGLLSGHRATTHHGAYEELAAIRPEIGTCAVDVVRGYRVVRSTDKLWTSAGVTAGIDLALEAVESFSDRSLRTAVAEEMEWGRGWGPHGSVSSGLTRSEALDVRERHID